MKGLDEHTLLSGRKKKMVARDGIHQDWENSNLSPFFDRRKSGERSNSSILGQPVWMKTLFFPSFLLLSSVAVPDQ